MGYRNKRQVALVPASQVDAFNKFMERNGYGANFLVPGEKNKIGAATDAKEKAPTHYSLEIPYADDGLIAAVRKAIISCNKKLIKDEVAGLEAVSFQPVEKIKDGEKVVDDSKIVKVEDLAADKGLVVKEKA